MKKWENVTEKVGGGIKGKSKGNGVEVLVRGGGRGFQT
jgi:hypothetical protein